MIPLNRVNPAFHPSPIIPQPSTALRDFLTHPACHPADLGLPLPDDPHAVSVAMPLWEHVVGYEEENPAVIKALKCGYPRFFVHPLVTKLFELATETQCKRDERALVLPSMAAAKRCVEFVKLRSGVAPRTEEWSGGMALVIAPKARWRELMQYWRFCGEVVSSRRAEAALQERFEASPSTADAKVMIRERLAKLTGQDASDVYLFPSGIAAIYASHRLVTAFLPERKTAQIEFPYVDVLKVQQEFGSGVKFVANPDRGGVSAVRKLIETEKLAGVFCEVASNPQLRTVDLEGLAQVLEPEGVPLVVDDTVSTCFNVDAFQHADVVTMSLTKFFSGVGDVMAGALVLRNDSPHNAALKRILDEIYDDDLWGSDAAVLEKNSRDFPARMVKINENTEAVVDSLTDRMDVIDRLWYPKTETPGFYEAIQREEGGYGGLFSMVLKDPKRNSPRFYNALRVSKGPSLGTNFTLACPYMLLAHYPELDWSDKLGIDRHLLRFSIGLEEPEELSSRFHAALDTL